MQRDGWDGAADVLSVEAIRAALDTTVVGAHVVYRRETTSTNDEARILARRGALDGTVVVSDYQAAGRGRLNRRWQAPPGTSLLLSIILRPELSLLKVQHLTMVSGLSMVQAIESETGLQIGLKWPNDLVHGEKKLGGILTETESGGHLIDCVIVGIGVNVNLDPEQLSGSLRAPATSLALILGRPVPRLRLLRAFLRELDVNYVRLRQGWSPLEAWMRKLVTLGRDVTVASFGTRIRGVAQTVDLDGHLVLRLPDGRQETIMAGDVLGGIEDS